jgi:Uma2 family endonuclease
LIDPKHRRVAIYRQGQPVEILENPKTLSGEEVLPNFVLDVSRIFGWG